MKRMFLLFAILTVTLAASAAPAAPRFSRWLRTQAPATRMPYAAVLNIPSWSIEKMRRNGKTTLVETPVMFEGTLAVSTNGREMAAVVLGDDFGHTVFVQVWKPSTGWKSWTEEGFTPYAFLDEETVLGVSSLKGVAMIREPVNGAPLNIPETFLATDWWVGEVAYDNKTGNTATTEIMSATERLWRVAIYGPDKSLIWTLETGEIEPSDISLSPITDEVMVRITDEWRVYDFSQEDSYREVLSSEALSAKFLPNGGLAWVTPLEGSPDPYVRWCTVWMQSPGSLAIGKSIYDGFVEGVFPF